MKQFFKNGLRLLLISSKGDTSDQRYRIDGAQLSRMDEIGRNLLCCCPTVEKTYVCAKK